MSSLEWGRIGSKISGLLTEPGEAPMTSDRYLSISSFIGSDGSRNTRRVDVSAVLGSAGIDLDAIMRGELQHSMVYHLPPSISSSSVIKHSTDTTSSSTSTGSGSSESLSVVYVLDPLTLAGQRATGIIKLFQNNLGLAQTIIVVPNPVLSEFPLQNFYRSLLSPRPVLAHTSSSTHTHSTTAAATETDNTSDEISTINVPIAAVFTSLPKQHTLTVRIDAPEGWNIQATNAIRDIDNLRCDHSNCGDPTPSGGPSDTTNVKYTLKSILLAGQCFEQIAATSGVPQSPFGNKRPPNGLQLVLSPAQSFAYLLNKSKSTASEDNTVDVVHHHHSDTLVMQNLGYFQLQANPGLWRYTTTTSNTYTLI